MTTPRGVTQVCKQPGDPSTPRRIRSAADRSGDRGKQPLRHLWWRFRHHSGIQQREAGGMQADKSGQMRVPFVLMGGPRTAQEADLAEEAGVALFAGGSAVTLPQARPLEGGVEVARIAYEGLSFGFEECDEPIACDTEQRPQQSAVVELANRRHPGEAVRAAVSSAADQMRLDLIIPMVTGQQVQTSVIAAPAAKQAIARKARRFLDTGARFFACPDQDFVAYGSRRQPGFELPNFVAAFRPQPVIHGKRTDLPAPLAGPTVRQNGQRQAVGTAGNGNREKRRALKLCDRGERGCKLTKGQRPGCRSASQQPSRFFSASECSLIELPGLGKS